MCMILVSVHNFFSQDNAPSNTILKSLFTYSASVEVAIFFLDKNTSILDLANKWL